MRSRAWLAAPVGAALALGGCTTYIGQKIGPGGEIAKPGGVPFVMTKPEYTLAIAPDATESTKPVYTLSVGYVPDATQRFTLALDPALLVNGKLDLDFGNHGNLTGAAATTTTRVIETFAALVSLGAKLETSALLDAASTLSAYEETLATIKTPECEALKKSLAALKAEAVREIPDRPNVKRQRAEWVGERLHYLSAAERDCVTAVAAKVKKDEEEPKEDRYNTAHGALEKAAESRADLALLAHQIKAEVAALNEDALEKIAAGQQGKPEFVLAKDAALAGAAFVKFRLASRFGRFLVDMSPEVWRARHLAYLERRIAVCRKELLVAGSKSPCADKDAADGLTKLTSQWSMTLGEPAVVERVTKIDLMLASVESSKRSDQGRHSMVQEHVKLREERDKLQARIDQLRSDLIGKNKVVALGPEPKKAAKVEPRTNLAVTLVKKDYVAAVNKDPKKFEKAPLPEFVLVLEPDDSGAVAPLPTPEEGKK